MPTPRRASGSWRGSRVLRVRRGTAWDNVCDLFSSKFMGPQTIDRRGGTNHSSPPPESGDSVDRIDMARRNFENDPADVRAAVPRELMRRTIC